MSDYEALLYFNRHPVSKEMIQFLASTTDSIIQINESSRQNEIPSLVQFISGLVRHSNVQTSTLMATTVYLTKLRSIIPAGVRGIDTTKHRIFLGCLILAAKTLNDSSPLNMHWTKYTDGLLRLSEVNTIERELLEYFSWDVMVTTNELIVCLSPFLKPIQSKLIARAQSLQKTYYPSKCVSVSDSEMSSRSSSNMSIPSLSTSSTASSFNSLKSTKSLQNTNIFTIDENNLPTSHKNISSQNVTSIDRPPLAARDMNSQSKSTLKKSRPIILNKLNTSHSNSKYQQSGASWQSLLA